ncbi:C-type natriuretic peptide-like [Dunckerocampus dactyliophorus]|uniref:C-type natriuretic peptide-like n=1 Tax=Dunckerocampus dactyliophorus TaxID=161453 RepID=UPI0024071CC0|nr:C-type natriuretic peptide-like [Dunckerocampus dactyliophorus]XP_054637675.1 C-type natriuretic peptide-like [Dunckerocampus dactyliophorus]
MLLCPLLLGTTLLFMAPLDTAEARALHPPPDSAQLMEQLLDRYNDLLTMDDLDNLLNSPAEEQSTLSSGAKASEFSTKWADVQAETPWLRLLREALANQKQAEPEQRSRRGWNRGCFGLKLDRIGSMSGLGC